jgi:hypothetical protein
LINEASNAFSLGVLEVVVAVVLDKVVVVVEIVQVDMVLNTF